MKVIKISGIVVAIFLIIVGSLLGASTIYHRTQLRKEAGEYSPSGRMVEVNGKKMHIFAAGEGDITLVFMSGHGTSSPTLDFKPLWMRMVDEYRIAVVEKSGYGWSEVSNSPRDIDTILEETRKGLLAAGEHGPYVLVPHSMSGLEAIYWAQKYPEEVKAIIGLDPLTPESKEILPEPDRAQLTIMYMISRSGISRYMPESDLEKNLPWMKSEDLTAADKQKYLAVFYRSAFSKDMLREVNYLQENFETVAAMPVPADTPMVFFISEGQDTRVEGWKEALSDYLAKVEYGRSLQLAADHYLHYEKADLIAEEAKAFLESLD